MNPTQLVPLAPTRAIRARRSLARLVIVALALLPICSLVVLELAGARGDVGFLSGTQPAHGDLELLSGGGYALSWFTTVVASPIVLGAAGLDYGLELLLRRYTSRR